jgi:hypothetical protein
MTVIIPDGKPNQIADPHDAIQEPAYQLFCKMCDQYEWCTDEWRTRMRPLIEALLRYFDYDANASVELAEMFREALKNARTCRGMAQLENWLRNERLARQQADLAVAK